MTKENLDLLERQAEELDIELIVMGSEGVEEEEVGDLKELIEKVVDKVEPNYLIPIKQTQCSRLRK